MSRYTPKQIQWLSSHIAGTSYAKLTEMFNRRFRLEKNAHQIKAICRYHGLLNGTHLHYHNYTAAEIRFIEKKIIGRRYSDLTVLFNNRFGTSLTAKQLQSIAHSKGLSNLLPSNRFQKGCSSWMKGIHKFYGPKDVQFQKGYTPYNTRPIGSERIKNGLIEIKVSKTQWKMKHVVIWEEANGSIPKNHVVIFADRDRSNFCLDNLLLVSRRELGSMNRHGLIFSNSDSTKTGKLIANVHLLANDRKYGRKMEVTRIDT